MWMCSFINTKKVLKLQQDTDCVSKHAPASINSVIARYICSMRPVENEFTPVIHPVVCYDWYRRLVCV